MSFFTMNDLFGDKEVDKELLRPKEFQEEINKYRQENAHFGDTNYFWCRNKDQRVHFKICDKMKTDEHCDCDARLAFDIREKQKNVKEAKDSL